MNEQATLSNPSTCGGTCDGGRTASAVQPDYRVQKRDEGVTLHLALPGVAKDHVQISLEKGLLTVVAERPGTLPEGWEARQGDVPPARYELRVRLHRDLDPASIQANLAEGVLTLEIERHEAAKPRTIKVN